MADGIPKQLFGKPAGPEKHLRVQVQSVDVRGGQRAPDIEPLFHLRADTLKLDSHFVE